MSRRGASFVRELSQAELDEYLDRLVSEGREDSPEFAAAYEEWEARG